MSGHKTADKVRADYAKAMGQDLGDLFHRLSSEVVWLHWRWRQYRLLFGEGPKRIALLNQTAPVFFRINQDILFEDTLLAIARITGPAKSAGRNNLSIERIPPLVSEATLRDEVRVLVEGVQVITAFAKDWRNRHLAHRDLDLALNASAQPLSPASREQVEQVLMALGGLLNHVQHGFGLGTTIYKPWSLTGDAESLLRTLQDGRNRQREREARWDAGETHADDLLPTEDI